MAEIHQRATEHEAFDKVKAASLAARNGEPIETTGRLLDKADATITRALLEAEKAMLPSQRARSHHWVPELVKAQQKAALMTKFCRAAMKNKTPLWVSQRFADQAQSIDTLWSLPERLPELLAEKEKLFKRRAIKAKKNARKLRYDDLKQKIQEQVACIDEDDRESYIQRIQKKEKLQMRHLIIKARIPSTGRAFR